MPSRADLDPTELPGRLWPNITLLDVIRDDGRLRFRYRRVGGEFVKALGHDPTGRFFDDVLPARAGYRDYVIGIYSQVALSGVPLYAESTFMLDGQTVPMLTRRVVLPLSRDGKGVDMILAGHTFEYDRLRAVQSGPLVSALIEIARIPIGDGPDG